METKSKEESTNQTYVKNLPLNFSSPSFPPTDSLPTTPPTSAGLKSFLSSYKAVNFAMSDGAITAGPLERITPCISVSTVPGRIARVVISGSSTERVSARWFCAALDEPYAPQVA